MKLTIINAKTDLGVMVDGSNLGPEIISNHFKEDKHINKIITIEKQNIIKIQSRRENILFTYKNNKFDDNFIQNLIQKYGNRIKFSDGVYPIITLKNEQNGEKALIEEIKKYL